MNNFKSTMYGERRKFSATVNSPVSVFSQSIKIFGKLCGQTNRTTANSSFVCFKAVSKRKMNISDNRPFFYYNNK